MSSRHLCTVFVTPSKTTPTEAECVTKYFRELWRELFDCSNLWSNNMNLSHWTIYRKQKKFGLSQSHTTENYAFNSIFATDINPNEMINFKLLFISQWPMVTDKNVVNLICARIVIYAPSNKINHIHIHLTGMFIKSVLIAAASFIVHVQLHFAFAFAVSKKIKLF